MRLIHSALFYCFDSGGEDGADAYGHVSTFLESLYRQAARKLRDEAVIFGHGLTNRVLVMRDMHLTIEQFLRIKNPDNCDVFAIAPLTRLIEAPQFKTGRQGVVGLKLGPPLL